MENNIREQVAQGITLCRQGQLEEGYALLNHVAHEGGFPEQCPSMAYSYWGYGMAALEAHYNEGVAACQTAIEIEFYQPENFFNLARTYMLLGARRKAMDAMEQGLRIDPSFKPLQRLGQRLGRRRPPVLPFLHRDNPLNRLLGRLRHDIRTPRSQKDD